MISLRQLRYLDALARHGHFGQAADACSVTQPALSMQIKEMEASLGVALIERRPRGARLTEDGVEIAARARRILADVAELEDFARGRGGLLSGPLRLGVIPSVAPYLLPPLLTGLKAAYPTLELRLRESQTERLVASLIDGELDLLLLALPIQAPGVETRPLFEDRFLLAAAEATPAGADPFDVLGGEQLLLLEDGHCLRDQALSFCGDRKSGDVDAFGASSLATVVQMVAVGLGVTLLPEMAAPVEAAAAPVRLLRFPPPAPARTIGLAWRTGSARKSDFAAFGDAVATIVRPRLPAADAQGILPAKTGRRKRP